VAGLQLRPRSDRSGLVSGPATIYASARVQPPHARQVTVLDLLDRLLAGGVVIRGQITLAAADIDLVDLDLSLLLAAVDKAAGR
jgi:Gas vesicle protein